MKKEKPLLARNIIARRKALGFTSARAFAEAAKLPYPTIRDIEAGVSHGQPGTKEIIAKALGCTADDLMAPDRPSLRSNTVGDLAPAELVSLIRAAKDGDGNESEARSEQVDSQQSYRQRYEAQYGSDEKSGPKGKVPPIGQEKIDSRGEGAKNNDDVHVLASEVANKILTALRPESSDELELLAIFKKASPKLRRTIIKTAVTLVAADKSQARPGRRIK